MELILTANNIEMRDERWYPDNERLNIFGKHLMPIETRSTSVIITLSLLLP